jgi:uncharacterized protein (DUF488 family)
METLIYTLGTGNRSAEDFLRLLRTWGIEIVADVRSFPNSRFPHFRRETLSKNLGEAGFGYTHLGRELGGFRKEGFEAYTQTYDYLRGIDLLARLAARSRCGVLCAERLPWKCHRRFIGESLRGRGWKVLHVIEEDRVWEPAAAKED